MHTDHCFEEISSAKAIQTSDSLRLGDFFFFFFTSLERHFSTEAEGKFSSVTDVRETVRPELHAT